MRIWLHGLFLVGLSALTASAMEVQLDQVNNEKCAGMYSRKAWGGDVDPFILTKFVKPTGEAVEDKVVGLIIYEWKDASLIGLVPPGSDKQIICDQQNVNDGYCNSTELGQFLLAPNATDASQNTIKTTAIHLNDPPATNFYVRSTGYYCVGTLGLSDDTSYKAIVEFRNAYGELSGAQIAKLPFYGGLAIAYAVLAAFWGFFYVQHRHDILAVQNYITAIIMFLIVEMLMTWGFYDYENRNGANTGSKVLMIVVAVLNAARNSFSFFLLLIVCMGYGVVKPSLGRTMIYVRWLAATHFVFGLIYSIASLIITPDSAGPLVLFVILPLASTLTAFYVWTLNSLNLTMKDLFERKQTVKAAMYRKLWYCILFSILVIFGFFFFNSFTFAGVSDPDFVPNNWKSRWFILDGWLNLVYFADVAFICYMWLPTANNRRFAMSDELAQDDEGFEVADFGADGDDSGDEEEGRAQGGQGPRYDPTPKPSAPKQNTTRDLPRESLDGETVFAVGEDGDKWSDDDEPHNLTEGRKLVGKEA
ncbi:MAG: hypothetical protein M1818_002593 [Claussenomyces sp. TS43310]|nr:MAG: hypothetical protein M1818_002593 [Claussenomyces sp. TS43310]